MKAVIIPILEDYDESNERLGVMVTMALDLEQEFILRNSAGWQKRCENLIGSLTKQMDDFDTSVCSMKFYRPSMDRVDIESCQSYLVGYQKRYWQLFSARINIY